MDRATLREILTGQFNDSELRNLCFDLDIDYESLGGDEKSGKARELIAHCERYARTADLVAACRRLRPHAFEREMSADMPSGSLRPESGEASDHGKAGTVVNTTISGNISGQVAIGNVSAIQIQTIGAARPEVTEADRAAVRALLAELKAQVEADAPFDKRGSAMERVKELEEAITAQEPDLATVEYVKGWFVKNIPALAGTVIGVVVNPSVGKLVQAAGVTLAHEYKRRFGGD
jgi:hypothetical protein